MPKGANRLNYDMQYLSDLI